MRNRVISAEKKKSLVNTIHRQAENTRKFRNQSRGDVPHIPEIKQMIGSLPAIDHNTDLPKQISDGDSYDTPIEEELNSQSLMSGLSSSRGRNQPGQTPTHDPLTASASLKQRDTLISNYISEERTDTYQFTDDSNEPEANDPSKHKRQDSNSNALV